MAGFTYTTSRTLAPGHVAGTTYTLHLRMRDADRARARRAAVNESIDGSQQETIYYGAVREWTFIARPFPATLLDVVREFLDSTEAGETFTFDPYGTDIAPHSPRSGRRQGDGYSEPRAVKTGGGGQNDFFTVTFVVRET